jgi:hypothetical protein
VAERRGEEVTQIVGLELLVLNVDVELGDANRQAKRRKAVVDRQKVCGGFRFPPKCACMPMPPMGRAEFLEAFYLTKEHVIPAVGWDRRWNAGFVEVQARVRIDIARGLEPLGHHVVA